MACIGWPFAIFLPLIIVSVSALVEQNGPPLWYRAYQSSSSAYRTELQELLSASAIDHGVRVIQDHRQYVDFDLRNRHQPSTLQLLQLLPASSLSLGTHLSDEALSGDNNEDLRQKCAAILEIWARCPSAGTVDDPQVCISLASQNKTGRYRRAVQKQPGLQSASQCMQEKILRVLELDLGCCICQDPRDADILFKLIPNCDGASPWTLEVPLLARIFPLRSLKRSSALSRRKTSKRLESFVVAKTADIQPDEVILDPFCNRGTILIEAAKHWPWASKFYGIDSDLGDLEHARMNADSTFTVLELYQLSSGSDTKQVECLTPSSIDKIITCLPFSKSKRFYANLLSTVSFMMKNEGQMVVVIDQESLQALLKAVVDSTVVETTWIREPAFSWGKVRASIVVLQCVPDQPALSPRKGRLPWEVSAKNQTNLSSDTLIWQNMRDQTMPPMVPLRKYHRARSSSNKIWMESGRVYRGS